MPFSRKLIIGFIVGFSLLTTIAHLWIFQQDPTHIVFEELYYIPILLGALFFGLKGALATFVLVSLFYLPYLFGPWATGFLEMADRILHLLFTGGFAFLAGYLIERDRKTLKQLEKDRYLTGLGQAAATIVHDLKTPLLAILGFARRLQAGKGDPDSGLQTIVESALKMEAIVSDVLNFAKPVQVETQEEDLREVVEQTAAGVQARAEAAGISIASELPTEPVLMAVDGLRLQRALANLTANAIEASRPGQEVRMVLTADQRQAIITIRDRGAGMDAETLENVFIPFFTRKSQGTGLGMAIVKKVIEAHGGRILIHSQPGRGTEVQVELPRG